MTSLFGPVRDHEQVLLCSDQRTGLRAIIAVYSTALGPSLGGTRFHPYADDDVALADALALSRAMAYKAACAGLDFGGGKAVIIGDPARDKSEPLLRAFGRHIASLGGRYITACDVGTYVDDMDVIARETRWVSGRSPAHGGSGDSGVLTAYGVFEGLRAAARHRWGASDLAGRRVGVSGVGKVGRRLVGHLVADGASVIVADVDPAALARVRAEFPSVQTVADPDQLFDLDLDVYSPCALGGGLNAETVTRLRAEIVCGGANNQLATPDIGRRLADAGVLYAPDFVVNAGGLIQVADEIEGYSPQRARARAARIFDTTAEVLRLAHDEDVTPATAAERLAERRIVEVGRLRGILLR
ncbi:Leu/Phe/Val dehydrogenase [Frankia gtarii]|uniref:Leu/Phe/Val dehydrogenase n=1 Tax=Frankia gtarii TaxID=2950102 RepID=UPI0021C0364B|nr:Glu/Leu/Phe/Val dehydrogenase dimerization domain-containing protein [Frankia gtarii]